jgi:hypothetical protein
MVPEGLQRTAVTTGTGSTAIHTAWMPLSCRLSSMNAAFMRYGPVLGSGSTKGGGTRDSRGQTRRELAGQTGHRRRGWGLAIRGAEAGA